MRMMRKSPFWTPILRNKRMRERARRIQLRTRRFLRKKRQPKKRKSLVFAIRSVLNSRRSGRRLRQVLTARMLNRSLSRASVTAAGLTIWQVPLAGTLTRPVTRELQRNLRQRLRPQLARFTSARPQLQKWSLTRHQGTAMKPNRAASLPSPLKAGRSTPR